MSEAASRDKLGLLEKEWETHTEDDQASLTLLRQLAQETIYLLPRSDQSFEEFALRLARKALLELYQGYMIGGFRGVSGVPTRLRSPRPPSQEVLEESLSDLIKVEVARAEVFRWAIASLCGELGDLLTRRLSSPLSRNPLRLLTNLRGRISLALLQTIGTPSRDENPEREFGLSLLHLLSGSSVIHHHEVEALCALASEWVQTFPFFPEEELRDLMRMLRSATLSPQDSERLASLFLTWKDVNRYPPERVLANRRQYAQALARAGRVQQGFGRLSTTPILLALLLGQRQPLLWGQETEGRGQARRRATLILALGILANSDADLFPSLFGQIEALIAQFLEISSADLESLIKVESKFAFLEILPAFLKHPAYLHDLVEHLTASDYQLLDDFGEDELKWLWQNFSLSRPLLQSLIELIRRYPQVQWLRSLIKGAHLMPDGRSWLTQQVVKESDETVLETMLSLYQQDREPHKSRLIKQLVDQIRVRGQNIPTPWIHWLVETQRKEPLGCLLSALPEFLSDDALRLSVFSLLQQLPREINKVHDLVPIILAACWLVDPQDALQVGQPLEKRLSQAIALLRRGRFDETVSALLQRAIPQAEDVRSCSASLAERGDYPALEVLKAYPLLGKILLEPLDDSMKMRAGAPRRLALARALRHRVPSPDDMALLLLADAFQVARAMYEGWSLAGGMPRYFPEFYWEADNLVRQIAETVASLEPVLPETVALLEEMLLAQYDMPEGGFSYEFSPAYIWRELLPLLIQREIAPRAVPLLVGLLARPLPEREREEQRLWQYALACLSNVSTLDPEQQVLVWKVGFASPFMLTRSLALLVLGRQRPPSEQTWQTVLNILQTSWWRLYQRRKKEISQLKDPSWFFTGDVFLLAGVAVAMAAEWLKTRVLDSKQIRLVHYALQRAASPLNQVIESRLSTSTHPMMGPEHSFAKSLALSLYAAVGKSGDEDPDWLVRPAELAQYILYQVLPPIE